MASSPEYIRELEKDLVIGDIASASRAIAQIYDCRVDGAIQKDRKVLEAIFLLWFIRPSAHITGLSDRCNEIGKTSWRAKAS